MNETRAPIAAPGFVALLGELRAPLEAAAFWLGAQRLDDLPRGDGHAVLFLPAFGLDETALRPMAGAIERLGYSVHGWGEGRNLGLSRSVAARLLGRLDALAAAHGPVSLVGWSAGGLYARELARVRPAAVRRVISFGAPLREATGWTLPALMRRLVDALRSLSGDAGLVPELSPPPVPVTAIHSRSDGIVAWQSALETDGGAIENVAVEGSHLGLGVNLEVLRIVAERLARPPPNRARRRNRPAAS